MRSSLNATENNQNEKRSKMTEKKEHRWNMPSKCSAFFLAFDIATAFEMLLDLVKWNPISIACFFLSNSLLSSLPIFALMSRCSDFFWILWNFCAFFKSFTSCFSIFFPHIYCQKSNFLFNKLFIFLILYKNCRYFWDH